MLKAMKYGLSITRYHWFRVKQCANGGSSSQICGEMGANKQWPLWFAFAAWRFPSSRNPMTLIAINYFCDILLLASNSSSQRRNINNQINRVVGVG
jgi:hypothetical protein